MVQLVILSVILRPERGAGRSLIDTGASSSLLLSGCPQHLLLVGEDSVTVRLAAVDVALLDDPRIHLRMSYWVTPWVA